MNRIRNLSFTAGPVEYGWGGFTILSDFIISQMEKFTEATKETQFTKAWGSLDELFRNVLIQVNGKKIYA